MLRCPFPSASALGVWQSTFERKKGLGDENRDDRSHADALNWVADHRVGHGIGKLLTRDEGRTR